MISVSGAREDLHCLCCKPASENSDRLTAEQLPGTRNASAQIFCEMGAEDFQPSPVSNQHDLPARSSSRLLYRSLQPFKLAAACEPQLRPEVNCNIERTECSWHGICSHLLMVSLQHHEALCST